MPDTASKKKSVEWGDLEKDSSPIGETRMDRIATCAQLITKPLRIFQFLMVLLIFVLIIYTIMLVDRKLSSLICILLVVLSGVYLFVLSIDLINQFVGQDTHTIPIFIFSFLGTIFYGAAGIFVLAVYTPTAPWYILTTAGILLCVWMLFIIDVSVIMVYWRRNCNVCKQCCNARQTDVLPQKDVCHPGCIETVKYDLTTSISSIKLNSGDESPDHSRRKIEHGHRRQYVDCPTSARVLNVTDAAAIQTELHETNTAHSQTQQDMKESPVQTVSRCELCNRKMQVFPDNADSSLFSAPQQTIAPCPALVQLLSGSSCCPGCRCITGIIQVPQQSQQQQTKRANKTKEDKEPPKDQAQWTKPTDKKANEMLTSKEHQLQDPKTGTITKLTLASYPMAAIRTDASSQTSNKEAGTTICYSTKKGNEGACTKKAKMPTENKENEQERSDVKNDVEMSVSVKEKTANNNTGKPTKPSTKKGLESPTKKGLESPTKKLLDNSKRANRKELSDTEKWIGFSTPESLESNNGKVSNNPGQQRSSFQSRQPVQIVNRPEDKSRAGNAAASLPGSPSINKRTKNTGDLKQGKQMIATTARMNSLEHGGKEADSDRTVSPTGIAAAPGAKKQTMNSARKVDENEKVCVTATRTEQSQETDMIDKPDIGIQTSYKAASLKNKKPFGFRNKNKVVPAGIRHTDADSQTVDSADNDASTNTQK